jgi:hypothetical protein
MNYNYINSVPQNAGVYINDVYAGSTPLYFQWSDSTFPKDIRIVYEGFREERFRVSGPGQINKFFNLIADGKTRILSQVKEDKSPYFDKPRKIAPIVISSIVTLGSGLAAYYFKSLAVDKREAYELNGDPAELDKKKKYDVLSGVSLVAFQLGFGALMYYLFLD